MAPKDTSVAMGADPRRTEPAEGRRPPENRPSDGPDGPVGAGPKPGAKRGAERVLTPGERVPVPVTAQTLPSIPADVAPAARLKRRHWGQLASFVALVFLPLLAIAYYLFDLAEDQYVSTTGFTVQREETGGASDFLGFGAVLMGASSASDTNILYEFIQSQEIVERIDARLDLRAHYAQHWEGSVFASDKAFSLWPDATIEDLLFHWSRVVRISYDQATGLIEVSVRAFDPDYARDLAHAVLDESQTMINALSDAAQQDAMRYALADLEVALARLKDARAALTRYRTATQILDPLADLESRLGVMNNLQQQLAESLIKYDLLRDTTSASDPRIAQAQRRISAIRERIVSERQTFASDDSSTGAVGEDYPTLIAEFERLTVDLEYAEQTYRAALAAVDVARENAVRQSRYLATYVEPTLAEKAEHPRRWVLFGLASLFLTLSWSIVVLISYAIRDRR